MPKTIIVGAGPGGLIAGRYLKDALILEQKKEIGKPVQCAEAISKSALEKEGIQPDPSWISATIETIEIISPSGKKIKIKRKEAGFILDRPLFEKALAKKSKAKIRLNSRVIDIEKEGPLWKVKTETGEIFKSKYLIGADGPSSIVRQKVFLKEKIEILPCIEYLVGLEKGLDLSVMKIYFDKERFPSGYAWCFPKSKNTANIGLGGKKELDKRFKDFLENTIFPEFGHFELLENRSGVVPWGGMKITLFKDNAFLVGDAGALADPIFGGGMANAMISARIAAECILSNKAKTYEERIKSHPNFSQELLSAQKILYSLPNSFLNQFAEVLERKDIFYLKTIPGFLELLSKDEIRKRLGKIIKFFSIIEKNTGSFT